MITDRRKFINSVGMTACVTAIGGLISPASAASRRTTAESDVARVVSRCGISKSVTRNASGGFDIQFEIFCYRKFADVFSNQSKLPFRDIHAAGNRLSFRHRGLDFNLIGVA
jgi:hypothetical protein